MRFVKFNFLRFVCFGDCLGIIDKIFSYVFRQFETLSGCQIIKRAISKYHHKNKTAAIFFVRLFARLCTVTLLHQVQHHRYVRATAENRCISA